jgi:hypothetical protein
MINISLRQNRDLPESLQRIEDLKAKNHLLLQTLKDIAASPNLDPNESANIREMIVTVGIHLRPNNLTEYRALV